MFGLKFLSKNKRNIKFSKAGAQTVKMDDCPTGYACEEYVLIHRLRELKAQEKDIKKQIEDLDEYSYLSGTKIFGFFLDIALYYRQPPRYSDDKNNVLYLLHALQVISVNYSVDDIKDISNAICIHTERKNKINELKRTLASIREDISKVESSLKL